MTGARMNEELAVHIAAFAAAIEDEVTAEKTSERTHRHALVEGTLVSDTGDENFLYFFSTPYEVNLPEEAMIQLEVDGRVVQGVYAGGDRDLVSIASSEFLGAQVRAATMIATPWDLLLKLEDRLNALKDEDDCGRALALLSPPAPGDSLPELNGAFVENRWLDPSQRDALQKVAERDVSFIWGPPGTGCANSWTATECPAAGTQQRGGRRRDARRRERLPGDAIPHPGRHDP